jgi:hypothetical protein
MISFIHSKHLLCWVIVHLQVCVMFITVTFRCPCNRIILALIPCVQAGDGTHLKTLNISACVHTWSSNHIHGLFWVICITFDPAVIIYLKPFASNGQTNSLYWIEVLSARRDPIAFKEHTDSIFRAEGFAKQ